jgi:hypothetical protein
MVEKCSVMEGGESRRSKWQKRRLKLRVGLRQSAGKTMIIAQSDRIEDICIKVAYENFRALKILTI